MLKITPNTVFNALLLTGFFGLVSLPVCAQSAATEDTEQQDSSEHVEESEEAYRRRMELEGESGQSDVMVNKPGTSLKPPEGMDALPYSSRKHLRDEMREVIIEQGEWSPDDASQVYPFTPSEAALKDPELRKQEEAAWLELVEEYHQREAAALAGGSGRDGGFSQGSGNGSSGGQGGTKEGESEAGQGQQAGRQGSSSSADSPQSASSSQAAPPSRNKDSASAGSAGTSQNALDFLKGQQAGGSTGSASGQPGGQPSSGQPSGNSQQEETEGSEDSADSVALNGSANESGMIPGQKNPADNGEKKPEEQVATKEQKKTADDAQTPPAGSLAIAELAALKSEELSPAEQPAESTPPASNQSEAEQQTTSSQSTSDSNAPPPKPGTLAIPELENAQGIEKDEP